MRGIFFAECAAQSQRCSLKKNGLISSPLPPSIKKKPKKKRRLRIKHTNPLKIIRGIIIQFTKSSRWVRVRTRRRQCFRFRPKREMHWFYHMIRVCFLSEQPFHRKSCLNFPVFSRRSMAAERISIWSVHRGRGSLNDFLAPRVCSANGNKRGKNWKTFSDDGSSFTFGFLFVFVIISVDINNSRDLKFTRNINNN